MDWGLRYGACCSAAGPVTVMESRYTPREEIANSIIHGLGIIASIVGLAVLVGFAARAGDTRALVAGSIFGTTLILAYTASTLYHGVPVARARPVLRKLDHVAIFLLIAGTYTPFTLLALDGPVGWTLFCVIWGLAIFGIIFEFTPLRRYTGLAVALYLLMGWAGIVAIKPLAASLERGGLTLMLLGGAAYTVGVVFYVWRRLPYSHAIWHAFVLTGSVLHYLAILFYIILD
jgi:hemolysin III